MPAGTRRRARSDATSRSHPRSRDPAAAGLGSRRRRALPPCLAPAARLLLDERLDDARLPVSLQLVREANLRAALHGAAAGGGGGRDRLAAADLPSRPSLDRRR